MSSGRKLRQHTQHSTMPAATRCNSMVKVTTNVVTNGDVRPFPGHKGLSRLVVAGALQDEQGEEGGSIYSSSPRAMLPSAAQPLSVRGRARYVGTDSMEGLQETPLTQVCCPLTSTDPQVNHRLAVAVAMYCIWYPQGCTIRLCTKWSVKCYVLKLQTEQCPVLVSRPDCPDCLHHPDDSADRSRL